MGAINIAIPFALITWAERSADSSLAAILTSPVPLFAAVLAPFFLPDEPIRLNGLVGLGLGFIGVVILVSPGLTGAGGDLTAMLALLAAAASYACGAIYARRNVRGLRPMVPAVFQVTFAGLYTLVLAFLIEQPLASTPDAQAVFSILWLGLLGSGLAYLCFFRLLGPWGATRLTMVAYVIPVVGIALGFLVPGRDDRRPDHHRDAGRPGRHRDRQQPLRAAARLRAPAGRAADGRRTGLTDPA